MPRIPPANLVLVQSCLTFRALERLLNCPPQAGDPDQLGQGDRRRAVAAVVRHLPGTVIASPQHPPMTRPIGGDRQPRPRVQPRTLVAHPGRVDLPRLLRETPG